ncbi:MAG: Gfo/Idh/MocA family oxidoreductase [Gemmatimonadota bacterium]
MTALGPDVPFLVVGCGSIGRRHLGNLKTLGATRLLAFDPSQERRAAAEADFGAEPVAALEEGLAALRAMGGAPGAPGAPHRAMGGTSGVSREATTDTPAGAVLLCSPTALHLEQAHQTVLAGAHLFIEKPINHVREGVPDLLREADARGVRILVGCNFRFDRGLRRMKESLAAGVVGRPLMASATFGQYLPDWHPWEDYRKGYSARKELGGGILLDAVHEMDAIRWLLGEVEAVSCFAGQVGDLEVDVEDHADLLLRFKSGITGQVHVDYLRRSYHRGVEVHGTEGSLIWTFQERELRRYHAEAKEWSVEEWKADPDYSVNTMYLDEMRHFIRVVQGTEPSVQDGWEGLRVLDIALAARRSAQSGQVEALPPWEER